MCAYMRWESRKKNNVVADDDDYNETQIMFNFNYKTVFFF